MVSSNQFMKRTHPLKVFMCFICSNFFVSLFQACLFVFLVDDIILHILAASSRQQLEFLWPSSVYTLVIFRVTQKISSFSKNYCSKFYGTISRIESCNIYKTEVYFLHLFGNFQIRWSREKFEWFKKVVLSKIGLKDTIKDILK